MEKNDTIGNKDLHRVANIFAVGYTKRMLGMQYSQLMETKLGRKLHELNRLNKYTIEAVLNGLVAYLSTKESQFGSSSVKQFLWELTKDVPSEISRRILYGDYQPENTKHPNTDMKAEKKEQGLVIEELLKMKSEDLEEFLKWLKITTNEERRIMAEIITKLTEKEQSKLKDLPSEQLKTLLSNVISADGSIHEPSKIKTGLSTLTAVFRSVNERLETRKGKL